MRVIAGTARGTKLTALPGEDVTRPTIDRVKEAMFSSLQFSLPGARVLDLFGGSGQLGIEALSRGAEHCTFVEQDRAAAAVIIANCKAARVFKQARVQLGQAELFLTSAPAGQFHIVLLDPPYNQYPGKDPAPGGPGDGPRGDRIVRERALGQPARRVRRAQKDPPAPVRKGAGDPV